MATFDAVLVGSGINTLTAAALLARETAGASACSSASDRLGGAIRTEADYTLPGFTHEVLSSWHPLFTGSAAYAELGDELHRRGLEYVNTELPTATAFPDGSRDVPRHDRWRRTSPSSTASRPATAPPGSASSRSSWRTPTSRSASSAPSSGRRAGLGLGQRMLRRFGRRGLLEFAGHALSTCRDWTTATFRAPEGARPARAVGAAHRARPGERGLRVHDPGDRLRRPARRDAGPGRRRCPARRRARGNRPRRRRRAPDRTRRSPGSRSPADGRSGSSSPTARPSARRGPWSRASRRPSSTARSSARATCRRMSTPPRPGYRYGRAGMQIHLALDEPPRWKGPDADRLARTAIVHVTPGLDGVSRAVNEAERGLLPAEATIVAGQPCAVDPSRAPEGKWIVWIQLQELPAGRVKGDAAGELDVGDGTWTEELREAYADRIVARLGESIENLGSATLAPHGPLPRRPRGAEPATSSRATSTREAARSTRTCSGARSPPRPGTATTVEDLWHVGASTHPGPGLGAGSGYLVAKELTKPPLPRRLVAKLPRCPTSSRTPRSEARREALPLHYLHPECVLRRGRRGVRRGGVRRDRPLGVQAARGRRRERRALARRRALGVELHSHRPVVPPARDPGDGRPRRSRGARRGDLRVDPTPGGLRPGVRALPERTARRPRRGRGTRDRRRRPAAGGAAPPETRASGSASSRSIRRSATSAGFVTLARRRARAARRGGRRRRRDHGGHVQPRPRADRRPRTRRPAAHGPPRRRRARPSRCPACVPCPSPRAARRRSSPRSAQPAGTARSTSRSSRRPTRSGRSPADEAARRAHAAVAALRDA